MPAAFGFDHACLVWRRSIHARQNSLHFLDRYKVAVVCLAAVLAGSSCSRLRPTESTYLKQASTELKREDYARAILELKNAAKLAPHDPEPVFQIAIAYEALGDLRATAICLRKAIQLDPKCLKAKVKLAELMARDPDADNTLLTEAESLAGSALTSAAERADAERVLAIILWRRGKVQEAEQMLQTTAAQHPGSAADTALADLYLETGRASQAQLLFRQFLQKNPKDAHALLGIAVIELQQGRLEDADRTYRRLASLPSPKYRSLHALFLLHSGNLDGAIAELEQLVDRNPKDRQTSTVLASTYLRADRTAAAEAALDTLLKNGSKNAEALLLRARLDLRDKKLRAAQADLDQVLHTDPNSAEAHYLSAILHRRNGEELTGRQELNQALRLDPAYLPARLELARQLLLAGDAGTALQLCNSAPVPQTDSLAVVIQRNRALLALGRQQEFKMSLNAALRVTRAPELLLQEGEFKLGQHDFRGAQADAEEALAKQPDDVNALNLLAASYTTRNQPAGAIEAIRQYIRQRPESIAAQEFLAQLLAAKGDLSEARQILTALRNKPGTASKAELALAQIDVAEGKLDAARKRLLPLAAGNNTQATLWLGIVEMQAGNYTSAIDNNRRILASDPQNVLALNNLAFVLSEHGGNAAEALKFAQNAAERAPEDPDVEGTLGIALYRNGACEQAKRHLESALSRKDNAVRRFYLSKVDRCLGYQDQSRSNLALAMQLDPKAVAERQSN